MSSQGSARSSFSRVSHHDSRRLRRWNFTYRIQCHAMLWFLDCLTFEDGIDRLSKNVGNVTFRSVTFQKSNDLSGLHLEASRCICCVLGVTLWCTAWWSRNIQQMINFWWLNTIQVRDAQIPGYWISEGGAKYFRHNYSIFSYETNVYHFICKEKKEPDNRAVHMLHENCDP